MDVDLTEYDEPELVVHKLSNGLDFVPRTTWKAKEPVERIPLKLPVIVVRVSTTTGVPCDSLERCCRRLRKIQHDQMKFDELDDIAYNFLVGADGRLYEGRGWEAQADFVEGEQRLTDVAVSIAFIGNYHKRSPVPPELEYVVDQFVKYYYDDGKIHPRGIQIEYREDFDGYIPDVNRPRYISEFKPTCSAY